MKKVFLFILPGILLFSCKKSDNSGGGGQPASTIIKKMIVHASGQPDVDTFSFTYDAQNRLSEYFAAGIDTTQGSSSYSFAKYDFIYPGNSTQATEYAYADNSGYSTVDLLSYNSAGQLIEDSTVGDGYMQISYGNSLIVNKFYFDGAAVGSSDSLFLDPNSNLNQWAEDTLSGTSYLQYFVINYDTYTANANPLYSLNPIAGILFEYGSTGLDPSFFYSKKLPSVESEDGVQLTYQYSLNGSVVKQISGSVPLSGSFTIDLYY